MTRERAKILAPIMQAYADGKTIQYKGVNKNFWIDLQYPSFDGIGIYRIKPEPREFWMVIQNDNFIVNMGWLHSGDALPTNVGENSTVIRVREVIK